MICTEGSCVRLSKDTKVLNGCAVPSFSNKFQESNSLRDPIAKRKWGGRGKMQRNLKANWTRWLTDEVGNMKCCLKNKGARSRKCKEICCLATDDLNQWRLLNNLSVPLVFQQYALIWEIIIMHFCALNSTLAEWILPSSVMITKCFQKTKWYTVKRIPERGKSQM